jgi:hypothetical protein
MSGASSGHQGRARQRGGHTPEQGAWGGVVGAVLMGWGALWSLGSQCYPTPDDPSACEVSRFGCGDEPTSGLTYLESCPQGLPALTAEVGQGEDRFVSFAEQGALTLHRGDQGGNHTFLAVRVQGAALSLYTQVQVSFRVYEDGACGGGLSDADATDASDAQAPDSVSVLDGEDEVTPRCQPNGARRVILGERTPMRIIDGAVEEFGVLVFIDQYASERWVNVEAEVEDPCRRTAHAQHRFLAP